MGTGTDFRASWNATFSVNIIDSSPLVPFKSSPLDTLKNKQVNLRHIYKGRSKFLSTWIQNIKNTLMARRI